MSSVNGDSNLKHQFDLLQQKQQEKLLRRKQKKEEKDKKSGENVVDTKASIAFGIDDDLDLKLADPPPKGSPGVSEELVDHLNEQIRELKDETGRLYKLLSERDFEVRQLRKKQEASKAAAASVGALASDSAATKIVDLSKKLREATAELESEKTKAKQWARKCMELENEVQSLSSGNHHKKAVNISEAPEKNLEAELRQTQDKLRQAEMKATELRNQTSSLKNDIKVAHKVLANEVGEGVNIQSLLNSPSGWRGRSQQIIGLQKKVQELKAQLDVQMGSRAGDFDLETEFMTGSITGSATSRGRSGMDDRQREQIRRLEKERKEAADRLAAEMKALEQDHETLKNKFEASKARNKALSMEVKSSKQQLQTLLEKGQHDDELIQALMKQQTQLKEMMDSSTLKKREEEEKEEEHKKKMAMKSQQETNVIQQLQSIVAQKEAKVKQLEDEINQMRIVSLQKAQLNEVNAMFERVASRAESRLQDEMVIQTGMQVEEDGTELTSASPPPSASRHSARASARQDRPSSDRPSSNRPSSNRPASYRPSSNTRQPNDRPSSSRKGSAREQNNTSAEAKLVTELQAQIQEYRSLYQATEVERDRLSQLIEVMHKRVDEETQKVIESQNCLQDQKRKNVLLEKQLGKVKVEQNNKSVSGSKRSAASNRIRASMTSLKDIEDEAGGNYNMEELQTSLAIQKDENEALKAALQSTLRAKEEDLKLYNEIMEETKRVFLQGLREFRQT